MLDLLTAVTPRLGLASQHPKLSDIHQCIPEIRGSAFGQPATIQAAGNLAASVITGPLWTALSPAAAFGYLVAWMLLGLILLLTTGRHTGAH
jgi:hypothetical protein